MKDSFDWNTAFPDGFTSPAMEYEQWEKMKYTKKTIRSVGLCTGLSLLGYIVFQSGLFMLFTALGLTKNYQSDPLYTAALDIVLTVLGLFLPFVIFGSVANRTTKKYLNVQSIPRSDAMGLGAPNNAVDFILAVVAGMGFCMLANMVTAYITVFIGAFGFELSTPDIAMPQGVTGFLVNVLRVSVVAALTEELALRGYVMGNLRPFGDKFAVIAASVVFAFMHGNLIQAPFALIVGFALGYLSIKTGSIWTGIVIHALNNLLSLVVTYSADILGEETANLVYTFVVYGLIIVGIICYLIFKRRTKNITLSSGVVNLPDSQKYRAFFLNPAMLLALGYMIYVTAQYVKRG